MAKRKRAYKLQDQQHHTWEEFQTIAKRRLTRDRDDVWGDSSIGDDDWRQGFTQTRDLSDALALAETGWEEGRARMLEGLEHDAGGNVPSLFPSREYDVAGEFPDVAAYCAGIPEHMVSHGEESLTGSPVVRIGINGAYHWGIGTEAINNFGIALLSHVAAFQRAGYSVALDWHSLAAMDDKVSWTRVEILAAGGTIDLDRLAFMLAHPSMLRRLWFAFIEQRPESKFIELGYGHSADWQDIKGWEYDGIMLQSLEKTPTDTVEEAAEAIGRVIEQARGTLPQDEAA